MANQHETLKARQRAERENYPTNLSLRVHRALSWLNRAEQESDSDSRFLFLWIAFNAAYATDIDDRLGLNEQEAFNKFLQKLHELDGKKQLDRLVWDAFSGPIRVLLDNPYVHAGFWEYQKGKKTKQEWEANFLSTKRAASMALGKQNTPALLSIVLSRIYVLRNQLMHGGATWAGKINRDQIRDSVALMDALVPTLIEIMMDNPNTLWGDVSFPVIKE